MSEADFEFYRSQPDFKNIEKFLQAEPVVIDEAALPAFKVDFSSVIMVDNLPIVNRDRFAKLLSVLTKLYVQVSPHLRESDIYMPFDESKDSSLGCCTVTFTSKEEVDSAVKLTNGYALGKNVLSVTKYSDFESLDKVTEDDALPDLTDFNARPPVADWLQDAQVRDMFAIRYGRETEINYYNTTAQEAPNVVYNGERERVGGRVWCELQVEWSPKGTYFVTYHAQGVKLWGGPEFRPLGKFMHPKVEEISFSPDENYLITYRMTDHPNLDASESVVVWDVRTGKKVRAFGLRSNLDAKFFAQGVVQIEDKTFKKVDKVVRGKIKEVTSQGYVVEEGGVAYTIEPSKVVAMQDPNRFKWSSDGRYFARLGPDLISIYNSRDGSLLNSKSFNAPDVLDFAWSPRDNYLAYWAPAVGNHPALISIVHVTASDRTVISSRKLVDVSEGKMAWHPEGNYLCVYMTKGQSKKRSFVFLFFRLRRPGVPVEQLELLDPIQKVAWEPQGDRIAIMQGDARNPFISFYTLITKVTIPGKTASAQPQIKYNDQIALLFTKSGQQVTEMQWSPMGTFIALAHFATECCRFEILDVTNNVSSGIRQHDRCNRISWDPSGRYLATYTMTELRNANSRGHVDDGVNFFHFQGNLAFQLKREKVFAFQWRPRPELLNADEKKEVSKKLKAYERQFDREDKERREVVNRELKAARFKVAKEFMTWRNRNRQTNAALKSSRIASRDGYDSDDDRNYEVITV